MCRPHYHSRVEVKPVRNVKPDISKQYKPYTPQEEIDRCLGCTLPDCNGDCERRATMIAKKLLNRALTLKEDRDGE